MNRAQRRAAKRNRVKVATPVTGPFGTTQPRVRNEPENGLLHGPHQGVTLHRFDTDEPMHVQTLAKILNISRQRIAVLVSDGRLSHNMTMIEAIRAYSHGLREQAAGRMGADGDGLDLAQERAALARELRVGHALKNRNARATFAPTELLREVLDMISQAVVAQIDQLPRQINEACPDLPAAAREQVMVAIAGARNEWVRTTEKLVAQKVIDVDDEPAETDLEA